MMHCHYQKKRRDEDDPAGWANEHRVERFPIDPMRRRPLPVLETRLIRGVEVSILGPIGSLYDRVVDDDGPSARWSFPWPFLAAGQPNPAYVLQLDAKEIGCSVAMLELMRRSEGVSYRSARAE